MFDVSFAHRLLAMKTDVFGDEKVNAAAARLARAAGVAGLTGRDLPLSGPEADGFLADCVLVIEATLVIVHSDPVMFHLLRESMGVAEFESWVNQQVSNLALAKMEVMAR